MHKNAPSRLRLFQHGMLLKFSYQMMMHDLSIHINAKSPFKVACYFICSSSNVILMGFTTKMQRGISQRWWMVLCGHLFSIVAMLEVLCLKDEGCKQTAPKCGFKSHCEYFANSVVTFARLCEIIVGTFIVGMCWCSPLGRSFVASMRVQLWEFIFMLQSVLFQLDFSCIGSLTVECLWRIDVLETMLEACCCVGSSRLRRREWKAHKNCPASVRVDTWVLLIRLLRVHNSVYKLFSNGKLCV